MSLLVTADVKKCRGYGSCMMEAPDFFDLDEDADQVIVLNSHPEESQRAHVDKAVRSCPAKALELVDSE